MPPGTNRTSSLRRPSSRHTAPAGRLLLAPDLLCDEAEAGLAVPGVLLYEPDLGACSVNEHGGDILSAGTCSIERDASLYSYLSTMFAEPDAVTEGTAHHALVSIEGPTR